MQSKITVAVKLFLGCAMQSGVFPLQTLSFCEVQQNLSSHLEESISCVRMIILKMCALTLKNRNLLNALIWE